MLLHDVVTSLDEVAGTRARSAKTARLADLLRAAASDDVPALVGLLLGRLRQGRVGVGWRTVASLVGADAAGVPGLSVAEVDAAVEALVAVPAGAGSAAARSAVLADLFRRATRPEQELLARVLTGEMRTGALEGVLLDAVAAAADAPADVVRRAAMLSGDVGGTAALALRDASALAGVGLHVGTPVSPMLASTATSVTDALAQTGVASVEYKLDGARIQVHRDGDDVLVVTRSLADVTARVPEVVEAVRALPVRQVVLDGETLLLGDDGAPRPFQETMSRFGARGGREAVLRPWFFDVIHLDGEDLLDRPLRERREVLIRIAPDLVIPGVVTDDPVVGEAFAAEALAAGHEGVLVKGIESAYAAGRRGKAWLKVKPVRTFDLVVLAAEWGSGRRQGWLSNLHLGARDPEGRYGEPGGFVMVGKTFKGLTDALLTWQTETFPQYEVRRTRGTVFVRPEIVVEIALDGVQTSSRYPGGVALRFARVKGYRPDKTAAEADTIEALRALLPGGEPAGSEPATADPVTVDSAADDVG